MPGPLIWMSPSSGRLPPLRMFPALTAEPRRALDWVNGSRSRADETTLVSVAAVFWM